MDGRLRTITASEVERLELLYRELARHHNEVSLHFGGDFPAVPIEQQLHECAEDLSKGKAVVAVIEVRGEPVAFCKVDGDTLFLGVSQEHVYPNTNYLVFGK